ncbi:MAG: hypothetical protein IPK19_13200 [Chloroflexi bacterium]|nr:hypothetical protein [Chloroflexota bacterium]
MVVPQGYTVVNLESDPFTFDRSRRPVINLIEGEGSSRKITPTSATPKLSTR